MSFNQLSLLVTVLFVFFNVAYGWLFVLSDSLLLVLSTFFVFFNVVFFRFLIHLLQTEREYAAMFFFTTYLIILGHIFVG